LLLEIFFHCITFTIALVEVIHCYELDCFNQDKRHSLSKMRVENFLGWRIAVDCGVVSYFHQHFAPFFFLVWGGVGNDKLVWIFLWAIFIDSRIPLYHHEFGVLFFRFHWSLLIN